MDKLEDIMKLGIAEAQSTMRQDMGGPFGAVIVKDGEVIAVCSNTVLSSHDPTAHAEINAIRKASALLQTHDLHGCVLFATGFPCPMCLSAIIWANIDRVFYGCNLDDAKEIGFRDDFIYEYIKNPENSGLLSMDSLGREDCLALYKEYQQENKSLY